MNFVQDIEAIVPFMEIGKDEALAKLESYSDLLLEWNQTHNLTGAKSKPKVQENILDSLYPLSFLESFEICIDVGSGAGFPGLCLAIARPNARFILTEPRVKRYAFLNFIKQHLGLENVEVKKEFAQNLTTKADLITSRAVMETTKLIALCSQILKNNGYYLLYKGVDSAPQSQKLDSTKIFRRDCRIYLYIKGSK